MNTGEKNITAIVSEKELLEAKLERLYQEYLAERVKKGTFFQYVQYKDKEVWDQLIAQKQKTSLGILDSTRRTFLQRLLMTLGGAMAPAQSGFTGPSWEEICSIAQYLAGLGARGIQENSRGSSFDGWNALVLEKILPRESLQAKVAGKILPELKNKKSVNGFDDLYSRRIDWCRHLKWKNDSPSRFKHTGVKFLSDRYTELARLLNQLPLGIQKTLKDSSHRLGPDGYRQILETGIRIEEGIIRSKKLCDLENQKWVACAEKNHYHGSYIADENAGIRERKGTEETLIVVDGIREQTQTVVNQIDSLLAA